MKKINKSEGTGQWNLYASKIEFLSQDDNWG